jgi:hypothetical protein
MRGPISLRSILATVAVVTPAWCWGSQDVSEEDVRSYQEAMPPHAWERIQPVMQARLEASRERQRDLAERRAILRDLLDALSEL